MDTTQTNMSEPQPGPSVTGAQALIESFLREGVDTIFGYPGGAIIPVYDALYDYRDRLRHILVRHEQGAVHAAQGYARVSGRVGVCLVTSGPGATNTVTGLADALMDSTPLVLVTGQVGSSLLGTDAFQETNFVGITQAVTKWNCQVKRTEEIPGAIAKAFYIARSGRPGPVVVDITKDAQCGTAPFSYEKVASIRSYVPASVPSEERIAEAARLIDAAQRPLAMIGQGVILSGGEAELRAFLDKSGMPAASTLLGLSALPTDSPQYVGMLGMHGNYGPNIKNRDCDLLLAVGMRFDDRVTGNPGCFGANAKIIHLEIDPAEIGKIVPADVPLVGDVKQTLPLLTGRIQARSHRAWIDEFRACDKIEYEKGDPPGGPSRRRPYPHGRSGRRRGPRLRQRRGAGDRRGSAADVRGPLFRVPPQPEHGDFGRAGNDGLRASRGHRGQAGRPRPRSVPFRGRRRPADDHSGVGHDLPVAGGREDRPAEQLVSGHGPPVAGAFLRPPLFVHRAGKPRFRADRPRQRHRLPLRRAARGALRSHRRDAGLPGCIPARSARRGRRQRISHGAGRRARRGDPAGVKSERAMEEQEYIITVFSENKVGLLNQITTVFTSRDVNIESLTTSESALAGIHKFTIVVRTGPERVEKLVRQIEKKIDVLKTFVYTSDEVVQQEIALYKVTRSRSVERLVRQHNVRILEIDDDYIVVEKTGHKAETKELFRLLQPYGVQQFVRSGIVAIIKSRRELLNEYLEELERSRRQTNSNHF